MSLNRLVNVEPLIDIDQLIELLGGGSEEKRVKKSTIYKWTHANSIPHIKVGKFLRFRWSAVERWLNKNTKEAKEVSYENI